MDLGVVRSLFDLVVDVVWLLLPKDSKVELVGWLLDSSLEL